MAVWIMRAGSYGQYEEKFFQDGRIYAAFPGLSVNFAILPDREALGEAVRRIYPNAGAGMLSTRIHEVWSFSQDMSKGDYVLLVLAGQPALAVGEVTGDYRFEHAAADPFYHGRAVNWLARQVPRWHFGNDLLLSFSSPLMICPLLRFDAGQRLTAMREHDWQPESADMDRSYDGLTCGLDLESVARDQLARRIALYCKEKGPLGFLAPLLKARGYTVGKISDTAETLHLLAAAGPLGFDQPRLCLQADFSAVPVQWPAVEALLASAEKHHADQALFISWTGFEDTVLERASADFFRLRLWTQQDLLQELYACCPALDAELLNRLQLRQIWIAAAKQ